MPHLSLGGLCPSPSKLSHQSNRSEGSETARSSPQTPAMLCRAKAQRCAGHWPVFLSLLKFAEASACRVIRKQRPRHAHTCSAPSAEDPSALQLLCSTWQHNEAWHGKFGDSKSTPQSPALSAARDRKSSRTRRVARAGSSENHARSVASVRRRQA